MKVLSNLGGLSTSGLSNNNRRWVLFHGIDNLLAVLIDREALALLLKLVLTSNKNTHFLHLLLSPFRAESVHGSTRVVIEYNFLHLFLTHRIRKFGMLRSINQGIQRRMKIKTTLLNVQVRRKIL